jgi:hypothetical protein
MRTMIMAILMVAALAIPTEAAALDCTDSCCCSDRDPCFSYCFACCSTTDAKSVAHALRELRECEAEAAKPAKATNPKK